MDRGYAVALDYATLEGLEGYGVKSAVATCQCTIPRLLVTISSLSTGPSSNLWGI